MSRILTTLIAVVALMLSMAAGQRMALADQTTAVVSAALDQHERHVGGIAVLTSIALDEHERHAAVTTSVPAALDQHERHSR